MNSTVASFLALLLLALPSAVQSQPVDGEEQARMHVCGTVVSVQRQAALCRSLLNSAPTGEELSRLLENWLAENGREIDAIRAWYALYAYFLVEKKGERTFQEIMSHEMNQCRAPARRIIDNFSQKSRSGQAEVCDAFSADLKAGLRAVGATALDKPLLEKFVRENALPPAQPGSRLYFDVLPELLR